LTRTKNCKVDEKKMENIERQVYTKMLKAEAFGDTATPITECEAISSDR